MQEYPETATLPQIVVTAVGSMPHTVPAEAVELVCRNLKNAPHPPQLSDYDPREQMWIQYTEGLPRFHVDLENISYYFDTTGDTMADVEKFYTEYLQVAEGGPADAFAVGTDFGTGIRLYVERLKAEGTRLPVAKAQVTGPLSFALTVTDNDKKPIFYHNEFRDIAVKGMGLKGAWLADLLKPFADNVIVFFDEPSLSAFGSSAFLGVSREDVIESLDDVIGMVTARGAAAGVHCCGNTDWGLLMDSTARIINFDAVDYMETMAIYPEKLNDFLGKGGVLAWGAVPNDERILGENADTVIERIQNGIDLLVTAGADRGLILKRMLITPACGSAGKSMEIVNAIYRVLGEIEQKTAKDFPFV